MYTKGMTTRQISETIEDIYGLEVSEEMVYHLIFGACEKISVNYTI